MTTANRRLIGHVVINSGTAVVCDPTIDCDLIDQAFDLMIEKTGTEVVSQDGLVICPTGIGDGVYPVWIETAELDDPFGGERVVKIEIDCGLTDLQHDFRDREIRRERGRGGDN
jgi:hypothetical protein